MTEIGDRLRELSDQAAFTMVDMAAWCGYDKSAMREWLKHDVMPHPLRVKHLTERLDMLVWALKNTAKLPVPVKIKQYERKAYVEVVRDYAIRKFPKVRSSK